MPREGHWEDLRDYLLFLLSQFQTRDGNVTGDAIANLVQPLRSQAYRRQHCWNCQWTPALCPGHSPDLPPSRPT